jgi:glycosyltransferase involved in cell wall biosynthesis
MSAHVPDRTIVVSKALQEGYLQRYGTMTDHIVNGSPEPRHLPARWITTELGLQPNRYVLFVGRLVPEKAPDLLARAFAMVDRDLPLVIAGGSSFTDGYVAELQELAGRDRRIIMPGYVFGDALHELYSNAAVFVLPSLLEGLPLTLLEALAYDRPVVASSIPPHVEVLRTSGPARRLVPPGEIEPLARAIEDAIDNRAAEAPAAQELGRWARRRYSWDAATDATEAVYLDLVAKKRRAAAPPRERVQLEPAGSAVEPADDTAGEAVTSAA